MLTASVHVSRVPFDLRASVEVTRTGQQQWLLFRLPEEVSAKESMPILWGLCSMRSVVSLCLLLHLDKTIVVVFV